MLPEASSCSVKDVFFVSYPDASIACCSPPWVVILYSSPRGCYRATQELRPAEGALSFQPAALLAASKAEKNATLLSGVCTAPPPQLLPGGSQQASGPQAETGWRQHSLAGLRLGQDRWSQMLCSHRPLCPSTSLLHWAPPTAIAVFWTLQAMRWGGRSVPASSPEG